jgi:hypothetical protein
MFTSSSVTQKSIGCTYPCPVRESNKLHQCSSEWKACVSWMRDHCDRRSLINLLNKKIFQYCDITTQPSITKKNHPKMSITVPPLLVQVAIRIHIFWHSVVEIVVLKFPIYKWNSLFSFPFIFLFSLLAASFNLSSLPSNYTGDSFAFFILLHFRILQQNLSLCVWSSQSNGVTFNFFSCCS